MLRRMSEIALDHRAWAATASSRLPLGFDLFDRRTGGIAPGELMMFLARPQVGKTAWAVNVIHRTGTGKNAVPTVFFSLEMDGQFIAQRLAAVTYEVATQNIELETMVHGRSNHMDALGRDYPKLLIEDTPSMRIRDMKRELEAAAEMLDEPIRLVIIDYLELVRVVSMESGGSKIEQISTELKRLARETNTSIIVLHQVPRGEKNAGDQPLSLVSGRYGGEAAADYMLSAYRPALKHGISQTEYELLKPQWYLQFLKTRSGGDIHPGGVRFHSDPETMVLREWNAT